MSNQSGEFILVLVTTGSEAEGANIAEALVKSRLAACVNMFPVSSIYRWQGEIQRDREMQLVIKTKQELYLSLESLIHSLHSYDIPEIIALPIIQGSNSYLGWLGNETFENFDTEI